MSSYYPQRRSAGIIGVVTVVLVVGVLAVYFFFNSSETTEEVVIPSDTAMLNQSVAPVVVDDVLPTTNGVAFQGAVLAGTSAPLLDFTKSDFDAAVASNKLIVLYFYANWCPICRAEFPKTETAFNELISDQVVGFRVNFNDNETDEFEEELAREHGVAYQHTKVFVRSQQQILKSPETWEKDRYLSEIQKAL
ncbi:MAG: thioredoxin family protein [Candidatus Andersenbacteria bacterium]|nr:thioredoxin family protein [Candidatus Andersenbacteria bacterium]MBI3251219.1 thioredoxin family protein [Candidatus Andersenbacteria bacterium]